MSESSEEKISRVLKETEASIPDSSKEHIEAALEKIKQKRNG